VNDRDFFRRQTVVRHQCLAGGAAVGDNMPNVPQGAAEEPRKIFSRPHRRDDGRVGSPVLDAVLQCPAMAVGHASHAEDDLGLFVRNDAIETRGKPVEASVERLQRALTNGRVEGWSQRPARAKGQQGGRVARGHEAPRQ